MSRPTFGSAPRICILVWLWRSTWENKQSTNVKRDTSWCGFEKNEEGIWILDCMKVQTQTQLWGILRRAVVISVLCWNIAAISSAGNCLVARFLSERAKSQIPNTLRRERWRHLIPKENFQTSSEQFWSVQSGGSPKFLYDGWDPGHFRSSKRIFFQHK